MRTLSSTDAAVLAGTTRPSILAWVKEGSLRPSLDEDQTLAFRRTDILAAYIRSNLGRAGAGLARLITATPEPELFAMFQAGKTHALVTRQGDCCPVLLSPTEIVSGEIAEFIEWARADDVVAVPQPVDVLTMYETVMRAAERIDSKGYRRRRARQKTIARSLRAKDN